ncbi:MAG TPA: hypothetical protein VE685_19090 [Thermoanaerobaculia bacterium]|nr:hypothetical protein [Thermoanaerobaculia bacterium]
MQDTVWIRRLFFALAVLYLLPVWTVRYLPTTDGPCHTYNAWVFHQLWSGEASPVIREHYEMNVRPFPNWTGQAVMAVLLFAMPPLVAEKVLVSGSLLLFLGGAWALAGAVRPDVRWPALLAFPFAYNLIFQFGFYNFNLSLGIYLVVLAVWWRHRTRPDLVFAVKINLLLLLCYFSHIVSLVLALFSIGVLWLATLRRESWRAHLLHVPILVPQLILPVWFLRSQGAGGVPPSSSWSFGTLLSYLVPPKVLLTFSEFQGWLAAVVTVAFLLLVVLTVRGKIVPDDGNRRKILVPEDGFLLLTAALVVLYMVAPEGMAGGNILLERLSLYPWLVLIPWLAPRLGVRGRATAIAGLTLMTLANLDYLVQWHGILGREMDRYVAGFDAVRPHSRVLALHFQRRGPAGRTEIFGHATGYAALDKELIDWDNYQAGTSFFPVRFRATVRPDIWRTYIDPNTFRVRENLDLVDAVYVWQMPPGHPLARRLRRFYRLVADKDGGTLWERKRNRHHFRKR